MKKISIILLIALYTLVLHAKKYSKDVCIEYAYNHLAVNNNVIDELFFVPTDEVKKIIVGLINSEKKSIKAALFRLTDKDIVEALLDAHKRGVRIILIVDHSALSSMAQKLDMIIKAKIPVYSYYKGPFSIMHHKIFIFESTLKNKQLVWYGSANATMGGMIRNFEVVHVTSQPRMVQRFNKEYALLQACPDQSLAKEGKPSSRPYGVPSFFERWLKSLKIPMPRLIF